MDMKANCRKLTLNLLELLLEIWLNLTDFVGSFRFKIPVFVLLGKFGYSSRVGSISNNTCKCI
jgi:hypothetical protein